jgi:hypothetical protein
MLIIWNVALGTHCFASSANGTSSSRLSRSTASRRTIISAVSSILASLPAPDGLVILLHYLAELMLRQSHLGPQGPQLLRRDATRMLEDAVSDQLVRSGDVADAVHLFARVITRHRHAVDHDVID